MIMRFVVTIFFSMIFSGLLIASDYSKGAGAVYLSESKNGASFNVSIYITDISDQTMNIEYYIVENTFSALELWQQFELSVSKSDGVKVKKGYYYFADSKVPEIMPEKMLEGQSNGVTVNDFLFKKKEELKKYFINREKIVLLGYPVECDHYQVTNNGQTVDYWLSEKARPTGLVRLVSESKTNQDQNYSLNLLRTIKNVGATIDPNKAIKATDKGLKRLKFKE